MNTTHFGALQTTFRHVIYAYIRISKASQSVKRQKSNFEKYIKENNISGQSIKWIEETASGAKAIRDRDLQTILDQIQEGDTFVTDEITRIGRTSLEVLSTLHKLIEAKCQVHIIESSLRLTNDISSQVMAFAMSLAAQIERELISSRTKDGLRAAKESGKKLGRPAGSDSAVERLEESREVIEQLIEAKVAKAAIARAVHCSKTTLYKFIKSRNLEPMDVTQN